VNKPNMSIELYLRNWIDETHFINLFPVGHPEHPNNFGDTVYHMCVIMIGLELRGLMTPFWLNSFKRGVHERVNGDEFIRSKWVDTPMNRDQCQFLAFAMKLIGAEDLGRKIIKKYMGWQRFVPHWYMTFERQFDNRKCHCLRWTCDQFEFIDANWDKERILNSAQKT